jgi:DNA-binding phage protein
MTKLAIAIETVSAFLAAELETRKDSGLKAYIAEASRAVKAFEIIATAAKKAQVQS